MNEEINCHVVYNNQLNQESLLESKPTVISNPDFLLG